MKKSIFRLFQKEQPSLVYSDFITRIKQISLNELTDGQLKDRAELLKKLEPQKEEDWIPSLALVSEVIYRTLGYRLFDTQIATAVSLLSGHIAELPTGEGKTLAAVLAAAVLAISGRKVHVLVFNDYLAKRDCQLSKPIYEFLDLPADYLQQSTPIAERHIIYRCPVVYVSAKEAGFDFLRNFLCQDKADFLDFEQDCAIVDEADSILIDDAKIPLVIAGAVPEDLVSPVSVSDAVSRLKSTDVEVNAPAKQAYLTDDGIRRIEHLLQITDLFAKENINVLTLVNAALQARFLLLRDKDYLVKNNSILIIDELTGRVSENRRYPDVLHTAVEAKEKLSLSCSSMIYNSITLREFLLRYQSLCGMTGTIQSAAEEIRSAYGLCVDIIPPHKPCVRIDHNDVLFRTNEAKMKTVASEIKRAHLTGQPVLVGTQSVKESEQLSSLLTEDEIAHAVLNAKNDEKEAELIAKAGEPYRVTISTNMAGRGVDIKLGGANEQNKEKVLAAGGLYVIGTGLNRSVRIDNQLRGRAGRQGDSGESRLFLSLDDPLLKQYSIMEDPRVKNSSEQVITNQGVLKLVRKYQKYTEGEDAEARYMLGRYSYIQEQQRKVITSVRNSILLEEKQPELMESRDPGYYQTLVATAGTGGVRKAERQLALYFINLRWAQYLESMEHVRDGIHLTLIGGKNPIDEYHRIAITAFEEMLQDIRNDVLSAMKRYRITAEGIDMEANGLSGATTTWTYMIDDSNTQFSRIPYLMKSASNKIKGTVFTIQEIYQHVLKHNSK